MSSSPDPSPAPSPPLSASDLVLHNQNLLTHILTTAGGNYLSLLDQLLYCRPTCRTWATIIKTQSQVHITLPPTHTHTPLLSSSPFAMSAFLRCLRKVEFTNTHTLFLPSSMLEDQDLSLLLAHYASTLECVCVCECPKLTDAGLMSALPLCTRIHTLSLRGCRGVKGQCLLGLQVTHTHTPPHPRCGLYMHTPDGACKCAKGSTCVCVCEGDPCDVSCGGEV